MANSISLAQRYLPLLDEIYKREALTNVLEDNEVKFLNANTVQLFKIAMDGLGDYARNSGYVDGSVNGTWESMALTKDRGRSFQVDAMDDEETIYMAFGKLVGEFMRTKVIPEIDAYRLSTLAGVSGITTATADITAGTTDIPALLDTAEEVLGDAEVPREGRLLFVSELCYKALKQKITRYLANENGVNREIEVYDGMEVRRVPKARFCTGIDLFDGTSSGETGGGYEFAASTSKPINFMIIHPSAVHGVVKHALPRIFSPLENQKANAWKFDYRVYHDIFVEANKVKGIYAHIASTGLSAKING